MVLNQTLTADKKVLWYIRAIDGKWGNKCFEDYTECDYQVLPVYKENKLWEDTMKIKWIARGCTPETALLTDTNNLEYSMALPDLQHMLKRAVIDEGSITGVWMYIKRGKNIGIKYLEVAK